MSGNLPLVVPSRASISGIFRRNGDAKFSVRVAPERHGLLAERPETLRHPESADVAFRHGSPSEPTLTSRRSRPKSASGKGPRSCGKLGMAQRRPAIEPKLG